MFAIDEDPVEINPVIGGHPPGVKERSRGKRLAITP